MRGCISSFTTSPTRSGGGPFSALCGGYGEWVQFSVFQCRLSRVRHAELIADLDRIIHHDEDHIVLMDIGPADKVEPKVVSLGKRPYTPVAREPIIV